MRVQSRVAIWRLVLIVYFASVGVLFATPLADGEQPIDPLQEALGDNHYLLIEFFLTTCPACERNWENLKATAKNFENQNMETVVVCMDKDEALAREFMEKNHPDLPFQVIYDPQRKLAREFLIRFTPTSILVTAEDLHDPFGQWKRIGVFSKQTDQEISQAIEKHNAVDQQSGLGGDL